MVESMQLLRTKLTTIGCREVFHGRFTNKKQIIPWWKKAVTESMDEDWMWRIIYPISMYVEIEIRYDINYYLRSFNIFSKFTHYIISPYSEGLAAKRQESATPIQFTSFIIFSRKMRQTMRIIGKKQTKFSTNQIQTEANGTDGLTNLNIIPKCTYSTS